MDTLELKKEERAEEPEEEARPRILGNGWEDYLTGSCDRRSFLQKTEAFLEKVSDKTEYAILFFNIKNFKAVNELLGIEGGDYLLREFYQKLKVSFLQPVYIARVEADHFVCLVRKRQLDLKRLPGFCEYVYVQKGKKMRLHCRCGIYYVGTCEVSVSGMIDRAKLAKEYIVDEYLKPYAVYECDMKQNYVNRAKVITEFEEAIAREEFKVYFQPIVETDTGDIVSAEALVRWEKPGEGLIAPGAFIPALENDGYISRLDQYVFHKVCSCLERRQREKLHTVPVSVNLSWMDFYDENLMADIVSVSRESGQSRVSIRYEVTETSYAALEERQGAMLEEIQKQGTIVLLDDFGSGYSSFNILQNYNFDILKIDMIVIRQLSVNDRTRKIVNSIISMAHQLGTRVVAEGVETEEQVEFLRRLGCDFIQGYYFYRPMPQQHFEELLNSMVTAQ